MKKYFLAFLTFLGLSISINALGVTQVQVLDKSVAIVNGDVITQSELDRRITMSNLPKQQALDTLIDDLLEIQLAERNNIKITDAEVNNAIKEIAKTNKIPVEQLINSLQEKGNMSFSEYKEEIHKRLLLPKTEQIFLGRNISISEAEITKVMKHPPIFDSAETLYHVADVIIDLPDNTKAINLAKQIALKLKQGVSPDKFDKQAQYSDLGTRKLSELPELFAKELVKMQIGQVSEPFRAPNGIHIIKLIETQGADASPQAVQITKEQAQAIVYRQKLEKLRKPWIKELREAAYIKLL